MASASDRLIVTGNATELLDRQTARGQMHVHSALGEHAEKLHEISGFLYGLIDVLLSKNIVTEDEIRPAISIAGDELRKYDPLDSAAVALRASSDRPTLPVVVDCSARLPVCKAVCCKLDFALSVDELESGSVKWDLGRPYFIRHDPDGCCTHRDQQTGSCTIYENRPAVCRSYSCANDARIWTNFDAMELNTDWIEQNLGHDRSPVLTQLLMHDRADLTSLVPASISRGAAR